MFGGEHPRTGLVVKAGMTRSKPEERHGNDAERGKGKGNRRVAAGYLADLSRRRRRSHYDINVVLNKRERGE